MADPKGSDWQKLYQEMLNETDLQKLQTKMQLVENALFFRSQELGMTAEGEAERSAIREACKGLLKVQVEKLGFPSNAPSGPFKGGG